MYIDYFLICKKLTAADAKRLKSPVYGSDANCLLTIAENCAYSYVCYSYKLVIFSNLDKVITPEALE